MSRFSKRFCYSAGKNEKYKDANGETSRLVMQESFDLWRATAPDAVNISGDFSTKGFALALHHLKPCKAADPKSICPELVIYAGPGLKF